MRTTVAGPTVLVRGHESSIGSAVVTALRSTSWAVIIDDDQAADDQTVDDQIADDQIAGDVVGDPTDAQVDGRDHGDPAARGVDCIVDARLADFDQVIRMSSGPATAIADTVTLADRLGVDHLVVVTSAMVYGALPNNPLPITEDAVLRPALEFEFARQLAAAEEVVDEWRRSDSRRKVAVLRPAVPISADGNSSLVSALTAGLGQRFARDDPPAQFVHVGDLANAVTVMVSDTLDGVFNVAPDSWIPGDRLRALAGARLRIPLPDRLAEVVESVRWRFQRGPIPPGLGSYIREPWVVANDKLKRTGWSPTITNEQAFVEGTESPWWSTVTPQRRQELSLAALVLVIIGSLVGFGAAARWWARRR